MPQLGNSPNLALTHTQGRTQLVTALGEQAIANLEKAGRLTIHEVDPTKTGAAGFVDAQGVIHLVASNSEKDALSVVLHEAVHIAKGTRFVEGDPSRIRLAHAALRLVGLKNFIGSPSFTTLAQEAYRMAAEGDATAQKALAKAQMEGEADAGVDVTEEFVAYLAQYADEKLPIVRRIMSAIRTTRFRVGITVRLTPCDVRALAVSALKTQAKAAGKVVQGQQRLAAAFSQSDSPAPLTPQQRFEYAVAGLQLLVGNLEGFQYPTSRQKEMVAIAKDLSPEHLMQVTEEEGVRSGKARLWRVTMPDGHKARVTLMPNGREIYIDASELEQGLSQGSLLYQLVGQWAYNNGKVFIGDPAGITEPGKARRLEHLISLALKFNDTDFILPHPDQHIPWRTEQHDYNLAQMLMRSSELIQNAIPDVKALRYDFGRRQFVNTDTGRTLGQADFAALAQSPGARAAQAGATTLKRSVLVHTVVQGAGREGWRSVLGALARLGSAEQRLDPQLKDTFYSRSTSTEDTADPARLWQYF